MPQVSLGEESELRPMNVLGELLGFNLQRAVWRFGFRPHTDLAQRFHISTDYPMLVLSWLNGRVIETWRLAWGDDMPLKFHHVVSWEPDYLLIQRAAATRHA